MADPETYGADLDTWEQVARVVRIVLAREYPGLGLKKSGRDTDNVRGAVFLGKPDSNIAKGSSGTVSIWNGNPGSESDTGDNLTTVYARTQAVTTTDFVYCYWVGQISGRWECNLAECA